MHTPPPPDDPARPHAAPLERVGAEAFDTPADERRFRDFMDHSPAVAFLKDAAGRFVYVNRTLTERFGLPESRWLGRTDRDLWPAAVATKLEQIDRQVLATGRTVSLYETVPTPDGHAHHWEVTKFTFRDAAGTVYLAGMGVDRTEQLTAEAALRRSELKYRSLLDRLAEGVLVVDVATRRFVDANRSLLDVLGYTAEELFALTPFHVVAHETRAEFDATVADMDRALARDGRCDLGRRRILRKDGTSFPADVRVTHVPDGGAGLHAVIVRDLTVELEAAERVRRYQEELEAANARLVRAARTDGLTGIANRAELNRRLDEAFAWAAANGRPLSLVMIDVDHFKAFNDAYGHPAGDEALKRVAAVLAETVRATDVVARYGGEEFAVVLPDTDYEGGMAMAERCRRAVADATWELRPITLSVGVSTRTDFTRDAEALVHEADEALYCSKRAGRNRVNHGSGVFLTPAARPH